MGGAEKQLLTLVEQQIIHGNKVIVFYLKGKPELYEDFARIGAGIIDQFANRSFLTQIIGLRKLISKSNFDVLHAHLPRSEVLAFFASKKNRILVISRHNAEPFWPNSKKVFSRVLSYLVTARSDKVIAISEAVASYVRVSKEISRNKAIDVVLYGYSKHPTQSSDYFEKFDPDENFRIGTIGRLVNQKNYPTLLNAFAIAKKTHSSISLYIVGEGILKEDLAVLSKGLGIQDSVFWLGRTGHINEFLETLDLFVLASEYEGFGLVLLEAMHAGVPILAANNSAIPEVLGSSYPGLFNTFDQNELANKICDQIDSEIDLRTFVEPQKRFFQAKRMYNEIECVYNTVI
jgi:glycosyltransferase involved in cell wall biosynthesis